MKLYFSFF